MKKTNKILTRALVILLTLVLITSSVVSSTFAKYVITKKAETTVGLQKFGLNVTLEGNGVGSAKVLNGDSITYEIKNITLAQGSDTYKDAITARVYGDPTVPARVTIDVSVSYGGKKFKVSKSAFSTLQEDTVYVPIAFTVNSNSVTTPYTDLNEATAASQIKSAIDTDGGFTDGVYEIKAKADKTFERVDESVKFGFLWPDTPDNDANKSLYDQIGTWLSGQEGENASTVTVTYTITVEQA